VSSPARIKNRSLTVSRPKYRHCADRRIGALRSSMTVRIAAARIGQLGATELLRLRERFFTTASPTVLVELHAFLTAEGVHPAARGWITSSLCFATCHPEPGE
jgi:hypothetical protein